MAHCVVRQELIEILYNLLGDTQTAAGFTVNQINAIRNELAKSPLVEAETTEAPALHSVPNEKD